MSSASATRSRLDFQREDQRRHYPSGQVNVGDAERLLSALGGAGLALFGLKQGSLGGLLAAAVGGSLVYRGLTGHCSMYARLGVSSAGPHGPATSVPAGRGVKVEETVTIHRSPDEMFRYWRDLENLPRFMRHLQAVKNRGNRRSHWVTQGPLGRRLEWDAEIITERPGELIGWRSLPGADVDNAGSVHFRPAPEGRGTEVRVVMKYDPPGGRIGSLVAQMLGEDPQRQIREDLNRLKQLLEAGAPQMAGAAR